LISRSVEKLPFGGPKRRWKNNMKMILGGGGRLLGWEVDRTR
jgi:hypothetical protein